jgi:hypothetical protein
MNDIKCKTCGRWRGIPDYCQCCDEQQEEQIKVLTAEIQRLNEALLDRQILDSDHLQND